MILPTPLEEKNQEDFRMCGCVMKKQEEATTREMEDKNPWFSSVFH